MEERFKRAYGLLGDRAMLKLKESKVAIFGLGGVGGACLEALARGGIYNFILVDNDLVDITNINRQILATEETLGRPKAEVAKERVLSINPKANVTVYKTFYLGDNSIIENGTSYIVDAIDTVTAKLSLAQFSKDMGIPIISAMGTGNKLEPEKLTLCDIYETKVCPLAKVMRRELKKRGITALNVVYSPEEPQKTGERTPQSVSFVPPVAGYIMAGKVIRDLIKEEVSNG